MSVVRAEESKVKITIPTKCGGLFNKMLNSLDLNLNKHLSGTEHTISSNVISRIKNKTNYTILFVEMEEVILSKSSYKITSFIDFLPYAQMFSELNNYAQKLKINLERYVNDYRSYPPYQKTGDFI